MAFLRRAALPALLAAAFVGPAAFGQPPSGYPVAPPPVRMPQPPAQTQCSSGVCLQPGMASAPPPAPFPPGSYSPFGYPTYLGRVGGTLAGQADVINASGQFLNSAQQARITQAQAEMARSQMRQTLDAERRYEQSLIPSTTELRQQEQWRKLQSARNDPPNNEIWSGAALNALFTALQGAETQGLRADPVPIDPEVLKHLNFTTGQASAAGAGMLKNVPNLNWPFALQDDPFKSSMDKINALAAKAVDEVKSTGRVTAATFKELEGAANALNNTVSANKDLSPSDWIASTSFLDELRTSIQTLRDPDVAKYFNGGFTAKGPTVSDLVQQMTSQGLHFAPATADDQPYYTVFYQALRTYDYRLAHMASR